MIVTLNPVVGSEDDTQPIVDGDKITHRGVTYDLTDLPDGGEVEADEDDPITKPIRRINREVHITLLYRYTTQTALPHQPTDIEAYRFQVESGVVPDPIIRKEVEHGD